MNRLRRISLKVEHRTISVTWTQTTQIAGEAYPPHKPNDAGQPDTCPDCGGPWLPDFSTAILDTHCSLDLLQTALQNNRLHLQYLPDGQLRVCERSFEQIREVP
jgi:hypothetical protein